jgi:hypothetical protein
MNPIKHPNLSEAMNKGSLWTTKFNFSDFFLMETSLDRFSDFRHEELAELVRFMAMERSS